MLSHFTSSLRNPYSCLVLLLLAQLGCFHVNAQTLDLEVDFSYQNVTGIAATAADTDGNLFVTGSYDGRYYDSYDFDPGTSVVNPLQDPSSDAFQEVFLAKYNASGALSWAVSSYTDGAEDFVVNEVITDESGNVFMVGSVLGVQARMIDTDLNNFAITGGFVSSTALYGAFVVKFNSSGVRQWVWNKAYGSLTDAFGESICLDASGDVLVGGYRINTGGNRQGMVWKLNSAGVEQSENLLTGAGAFFKDLDIDPSGNIYVTGRISGTVDFDPSAGTANLTGSTNGDVVLAKYNFSFAYQWAVKLTSATEQETGEQIQLDGSGNLFVLTKKASNQTQIFKLNNSGTTTTSISLTAATSVEPQHLDLNSDDEVYISGFAVGSIDTDPSANSDNLSGSFIAKYANDLTYVYGYEAGNSLTGFSIAPDDQLVFAFNSGLYSKLYRLTEGDVVSPTVSGLSPIASASGINRDTDFSITFSETIQATAGMFWTIRRYADDELIESYALTGPEVQLSGSTATLDRDANLDFNTTYYIGIGAGGFKDMAGNNFAGFTNKEEWKFTTRTDNLAPVVTDRSPENGATDVSRTSDVMLSFDETITTINGGFMGIYKYDDDALVLSRNYVGAPLNATSESFTGNTFNYGTKYYVIVQANTFKDLNNNVFAGFTSKDDWSFTIVNDPNYEAVPPVMSSTSPTNNATGVSLQPGLTVTFNETVYAPTSGSIEIREYETDAVVHTLSISAGSYNTEQFLVEQIPVVLSAETKYYVHIPHGTYLDVWDNPFAGTTKDSWTFTTAAALADPVLLSTIPAVDATDSWLYPTRLTLTFDQNIQVNESATGTIGIYRADHTLFREVSTSGIFTLYGGPNAAFEMSSPFEPSTTYYIIVGNDIFKNAQNGFFEGFSDEETWTFTTESSANAYNVISSFSPTRGATGVSTDLAALELSFDVDAFDNEGYIRLRKQLDDSIVKEWLISEDVTIDYDNSIFNFPMGTTTLEANTTYYVEHPENDPEQFSAGVIRYTYAVGELETDIILPTWSDTYWTFTTGSAINPDALNLVSLTPAHNSTNVPVDSHLTLTFVENVTIGAGSISIHKVSDGSLVTSLSNYNSFYMTIDGTSITFSFPNNLPFGELLYINVTDGYLRKSANGAHQWTGIQDNSTWRFTTSKEEVIWSGSVWSNGSGPGALKKAKIAGDYTFSTHGAFQCDDLIIENGITLTVDNEGDLKVNGDLTNNGTLILKSGSQLITLGAVFGTDYLIERTTTFDQSTGRYSIVGSPIGDAAFDVLGPNAWIYGYDESMPYGSNDGLDRFKTPSQLSQTTMQSGQGYFSAFTGDASGKVTFMGTPNTGTINVSLSYTDQGSTEEEDHEGFNLVSNPYPAAIIANDFIDANSSVIDQTIYLWDDNDSESGRGTNADYLMVNRTLGATNTPAAGGANKWDGSIRSGQGFFVKTSSAGTLTFTDALKDPSNANTDDGFFRLEPVTRYKLLLSHDQYAKATILGYLDDATVGHDAAYDALNMEGGMLQLYTLNTNGKQLGIQGLPVNHDQSVRLGFAASEAGIYTISLANLEEISASYFLQDTYTGKKVDLTRAGYTFQTQSGRFNDRFLLLAPQTITGLEDQHKIRVYSQDGYLHLMSELPIKAGSEYRVIDLMGKTVKKGQVEGDTTKVEIYVADLLPHVYLLTVRQENSLWSGKVIVN